MDKLDYFKEIKSLKFLYKLKEIIRYKQIHNESVAEHIYSSMMLAKYFLKKIDEDLDEDKIFNLLLYHDIVEISAGDVWFGDDEEVKSKKENELKGVDILKKNMPESLFEEFVSYFDEFERNDTREAKFANAIDKLDPYFECFLNPHITQTLKVSGKMLKEKKEKYFVEFKEIYDFYLYLMDYFFKNGYLVD